MILPVLNREGENRRAPLCTDKGLSIRIPGFGRDGDVGMKTIRSALLWCAGGIEADYHFSIPLWGYLTRKWGNIPITRENRALAIRALDGATRILRAGTSIVVLPEGHRTLNGQVGPFKKGPFHLALATGADILPFAVSGLYEYRSKEGWHLSPRTANVAFGAPIAYESYKDSTVDDILFRVHREIVTLKDDRSRVA